MSHEITIRASGLAEFAYSGEAAWTGLGQSIEAFLAARGRTVDSATVEDWQECAGMQWRISRSKVRYFADRDGATQMEFPDSHVLMRSDTKAPLSIVSNRYKTVQPRQVLEFLQGLASDVGFKLETAGTLFGGRKFWGLANIGESFTVASGDVVRGYLLVATTCDGSAKTTARFVATRVVCNNTMRAAMSEDSKHIVTLSHRSEFDADAIRDELGIVHFAEFGEAAKSLAEVKLEADQAASFVRQLLRPTEAPKQEKTFADLLAQPFTPRDIEAAEEKRAPKGEAEILRLFNGAAIGDAIPGVHGTAWGMLNAVTEYVDHRATAKTASHRVNSAWFNGGDDLKTSAFEQLLAMR